MRMQLNIYARVKILSKLNWTSGESHLLGKFFKQHLTLIRRAFIRLFIYYMTETIT